MKGTLQQEGPDILVLELLDRQDSNMILEGSEQQGAPVVLDGPGRRRILSTSHMLKGEDLIPIRYIKGCPTILVSEQEEKGYQPNHEQDLIWFEACMLTVVKSPMNKSLYEFLREAAYNQDATYRPEEYKPIYREIKKQAIARDVLGLEEEIAQAKSTVLSLRTKIGGKKDSGYEYDVNRINFLSLLFGIAGADSAEEKMGALLSVAGSRPEYFNNTIADRTASLRGDVLMAQQLSVLAIDKGAASMMSNQQIFFTSRARTKDQQMDELVTFFLTEDGSPIYKELLLELEVAKLKAGSQS